MQASPHLFVAEGRPEQATLLSVAATWLTRLAEQLMPDEQGSTQGPAGVTGGRLNPDIVERSLAQQPAVGHAVERHPAGQYQVFHPAPAMQIASEAQHH